MIAKHSAQQSHGGEGVEVVENCPYEDPVHGKGQYTEKRIHLSRLKFKNFFRQSTAAVPLTDFGLGMGDIGNLESRYGVMALFNPKAIMAIKISALLRIITHDYSII